MVALYAISNPSVRVEYSDFADGLRIFNKLRQLGPHSVQTVDNSLGEVSALKMSIVGNRWATWFGQNFPIKSES